MESRSNSPERTPVQLRVYNTMSRSKETFEPIEAGKVKMFTCGPSIYQRPHVGNYRTFLFEDVLLRYLEYGGFEVERVINFTDVEDKAIAESAKEGKTLQEVTEQAGNHFFEDCRNLGIKIPAFIPRSSTTVDQAVKLIQILLDKGYAYWDKGDVFFQSLKFKGFGKLFRLDMSRWPNRTRRFRKDTYPGTQWNLGDFVLWHGWKDGETIFWDTEIGRGRPAWNVQDPAIITKHLGFRIDISCGGADNLYRHHDYNIAVIEAVSGEEFSRYWMHGEHLLIDGKKMSKSRGNIVYPDDLLRDGATFEHVRFYLIYGRHREKMNLTRQSFAQARERLDAFREMVKDVIAGGGEGDGADVSSDGVVRDLIAGLAPGFEKGMSDDLDVIAAFDAVFGAVKELLECKRKGRFGGGDSGVIEKELRRMDEVLQVMF